MSEVSGNDAGRCLSDESSHDLAISAVSRVSFLSPLGSLPRRQRETSSTAGASAVQARRTGRTEKIHELIEAIEDGDVRALCAQSRSWNETHGYAQPSQCARDACQPIQIAQARRLAEIEAVKIAIGAQIGRLGRQGLASKRQSIGRRRIRTGALRNLPADLRRPRARHHKGSEPHRRRAGQSPRLDLASDEPTSRRSN